MDHAVRFGHRSSLILHAHVLKLAGVIFQVKGHARHFGILSAVGMDRNIVLCALCHGVGGDHADFHLSSQVFHAVPGEGLDLGAIGVGKGVRPQGLGGQLASLRIVFTVQNRLAVHFDVRQCCFLTTAGGDGRHTGLLVYLHSASVPRSGKDRRIQGLVGRFYLLSRHRRAVQPSQGNIRLRTILHITTAVAVCADDKVTGTLSRPPNGSWCRNGLHQFPIDVELYRIPIIGSQDMVPFSCCDRCHGGFIASGCVAVHDDLAILHTQTDAATLLIGKYLVLTSGRNFVHLEDYFNGHAIRHGRIVLII